MSENSNENLLEIHEEDNALLFRLFVLPRASRNQITGEHDGALKIKLTAPPVDNAANKLCISYLAKSLGLPKSDIEIASGHTGRNKKVRVFCTSDRNSKDQIRKKIVSLLS